MKLRFTILTVTGAVLAVAVSLSGRAQPEPTHLRLGVEKPFEKFDTIQIRNFQEESLGRITDLGIDLINGRIVEVLVESDSSLKVGNKIVAVPPLALIPDLANEVYRINVGTDVFTTAAAIDLSKWLDAGRSDRIAEAYRHFGREPYFLVGDETAGKTGKRPKVALGYVERASKILDLPVGNPGNEQFGKVWSLNFDICKGRIVSVVVLAPGNFKTKSVIPAMALSFNATRDALLLNESKIEFRDEPRYVFTEAAFGQKAHSEEESYEGPRTSVALEQGSSYRDVDRTIRIYKDIRAAKIDGRHVQVGTINGRVTVRGWVDSAEDQRRIGEIAIAAATLEQVDNQIVVGKPAAAN